MQQHDQHGAGEEHYDNRVTSESETAMRERLMRESELAREDARAARAEADAANRAKSDFLAMMSHEFRTPLHAVLGYAQLLDMGVLGPANAAQHEHLQRLQASAAHLLQLVDDMLDLAKVDADRLDVRREPHLTGTALAAAVALVQPQATSKGIRLVDFGGDTAGVVYLGDEHRVRQILVNLISNAVKFTPPGGLVTVTCGELRRHLVGNDERDRSSREGEGEQPPLMAFIRVTDTGPGIPADMLSRIFDPFVQASSTITREQGGTGLGLTISRRLARLMDGEITVESSENGSIFTLWLPAAQRTPTVEAERPADVSAPIALRSGLTLRSNVELSDRGFDVLFAISVRLAMSADTVSQRYVAAIRADPRFPAADRLPLVQISDHFTVLVALVASQLMVLGETRAQALELLRDGGHAQRVMAEMHGRQRWRLGWTEEDIERETRLLMQEIERSISEAVEVSGSSTVLNNAQVIAQDEDMLRVAREARNYAISVMQQVLEQWLRVSLRAHRLAKASLD